MIDSNGYVMSADRQVVRIEDGLHHCILLMAKILPLGLRVGRLTRTEQIPDF